MNDFSSFEFLPQILKNVNRIGYTQPTPIQEQSIPHLMKGKDLMGVAQTGTGKTAAFSLPLIDHIAQQKTMPKANHCRCLILVPTRELAQQVLDNIRGFSQGLKITSAAIYGGVSQRPQVSALSRGLDILVATPGRLEDLMQQGHLNLSGLSVLVLDEADCMLEIGFLPAIRRIVSHIPKQRQTLMFSATMPPAIVKLSQTLLIDPVMVETSPGSPTVDRITQQVVHLPKNRKVSYLQEVLSEGGIYQALIFSRTKHGADKLKRDLDRANFSCEALHGNKSQANRQRTLDRFRKGKLQLLIATDIANRGIDIEGVSHVINYDMPVEPDSYVHRIGRTGRAGKEGIAISFCTPDESNRLKSIERTIKMKLSVRERIYQKDVPSQSPRFEGTKATTEETSENSRPRYPKKAQGQKPGKSPSNRFSDRKRNDSRKPKSNFEKPRGNRNGSAPRRSA